MDVFHSIKHQFLDAFVVVIINPVLVYRMLASDGFLGKQGARRQSHLRIHNYSYTNSHTVNIISSSMSMIGSAPIVMPTHIVEYIPFFLLNQILYLKKNHM